MATPPGASPTTVRPSSAPPADDEPNPVDHDGHLLQPAGSGGPTLNPEAAEAAEAAEEA